MMRGAGVLVALVGCNQFYDLPETGLRPGDAAVTYCFGDDFNDNDLDRMRWRPLYEPHPVTPTETAMELQFPIGAGVNGYNGLVSESFDMTDGLLSGRMFPALLVGYTEVNFVLEAAALTKYTFRIGVNRLFLSAIVNNNPDAPDTELPYDAAAFAYLRFRHDNLSNRLDFDTSADGTAWMTRKTSVLPGQPTGAQLTLIVGAFQSPPQASIARYDDIVLAAPSCTSR